MVSLKDARNGKSIDTIAQEIRELPDVEKLRLVDAILTDLDKPDPEIVRSGRRRRVSDPLKREDLDEFVQCSSRHVLCRPPLAGPNSRILRVKTVWMQEFGTGITKFITLYPDRGETP